MAVTPNNNIAIALPRLWHNAGYTSRVLKSYFSVTTYAEDADGRCWGSFNPQIIPGENRIAFDWMLEAIPENLEKLLHEIERRAFSA